MKEKLVSFWFTLNKKFGREKILVAAIVLVVVALTLWISQAPQEAIPSDPQELGVLIPAGQLVVPLELANASALSGLINKQAIIDVLQSKNPKPIVVGLRVMKLSAGEGPLFGALVPEQLASRLQDLSAKGNLRGAIRTNQNVPTRFNFRELSSKSSLTEIQTGD